jgi:hypothetical protein
LNNEDKRVTAFKFFYILSYISTTFITWLWDVKMDWCVLCGFRFTSLIASLTPVPMHPKHPPKSPNHLTLTPTKPNPTQPHLTNTRGLFVDHRGLRPHLLFRRHVWVYYLAIFLDFFLRFLWTVSLLPDATEGGLAYFQLRFRFLTPLLELLRRSMWAWLRLEREQSIRDEQEGLSCPVPSAADDDEAKRRKRACKNRQERTRRLAHIREEVARLTKAVQLIRSRHGSTRALHQPPSSKPSAMDGSASRSGMPGVGGWDEDVDEEGVDGEGEEDGDDDDEVLESQKVMQQDLVSPRSVVVEVGLVLLTFVGIAVWAAKVK